jgi:tetratricopeptide (TPR) repeat protein
MRIAVVAILLSAAIATPARAAGSDDEERARGHYEIGLGLYRLGDYRGALKEFAAGYELARKPGFLLNLGQTYRKLGELPKARDLYRQFLAESRRDDPARPEAETVLAELEAAIRAQPPPEPPPPPPPTATPPSAAAPPVAPVVVPPPAPSVVASAPRHPHRRGLRIAGVVVGVVGLGLVGGGVGETFAADGAARDLNALDRTGGAWDPSKASAYSLDRALSTGFFAAGAALATGGAILLIVSAR